MPDDPADDDKKVKDLLDPRTQADLARWFGMPSFEQLADRGINPEPPPPRSPAEEAALDQDEQRRRKRDAAFAAVDPAFHEAIVRRSAPADHLLKLPPPPTLRADPSIAKLDVQMIARVGRLADPRDYERPEALSDDLHDCTPQALLRDLHRPETTFTKEYELSEPPQAHLLTGAAETRALMAARYVTKLDVAIVRDALALWRAARAERDGQAWGKIRTPGRRVTE
jgi:hypothetical protein